MGTKKILSARLLLLPALLAAAALAEPLAAQREPQPRRIRVDLAGHVVDTNTGTPVRNAVVEMPAHRRSVVTDSAGRFVIRRIPPGAQRVKVSRLGYVGVMQEVRVPEQGLSGAEFRVISQPMTLERITVLGDRFESRRRAVSTWVRVIKQEEILGSGARSAADVVGRRIYRTTCKDFSWNCTWSRGERQRVSVFIDDVPSFGGLEHLELYYPQDLYMVETYGDASVRVYTNQYVDWLARTNRTPDPILRWQ